MKFNVGDLVILGSFHGTQQPSKEIRNSENYWKLIGKSGVVVKTENQSSHKLPKHELGERVLIKFNYDVSVLGLHCHNEIENSLWIFISDLYHDSSASV
jgi:hypothetical protein